MPLPDDSSPGAFFCVLKRDGEQARDGAGYGKGDRDTAETGAVFEALEHHLSGLAGMDARALRIRPAHSFEGSAHTSDIAVSSE